MTDHYARLLNVLRHFRRVLVTGPQRSGTTIAARCLAADLGYEFFPEEAFGTHDLFRAAGFCLGRNPFVLQGPGIAWACHAWPGAVVWMRRDPAEVRASEERIGWDDALERAKYGYPPGRVSDWKVRCWDAWQKALTAHPFELDYRALATHPLWVADEGRRDFGPRQTSTEPPAQGGT